MSLLAMLLFCHVTARQSARVGVVRRNLDVPQRHCARENAEQQARAQASRLRQKRTPSGGGASP
jgi:hypothetical protein